MAEAFSKVSKGLPTVKIDFADRITHFNGLFSPGNESLQGSPNPKEIFILVVDLPRSALPVGVKIVPEIRLQIILWSRICSRICSQICSRICDRMNFSFYRVFASLLLARTPFPQLI